MKKGEQYKIRSEYYELWALALQWAEHWIPPYSAIITIEYVFPSGERAMVSVNGFEEWEDITLELLNEKFTLHRGVE